MQLLVVAGVNGRFDLLSPLLERFDHCISIGDFNLFGPSCNVENFCAKKYIKEAEKAKADLLKFRTFSRVYHIYGSRDDLCSDPFGFFSKRGIFFPGTLMTLYGVQFHVLSGYYNFSPLKKDYCGYEESPKTKLLLNEPKINALKENIKTTKNKQEKTLLFSYESPGGYPFLGRGCPQLTPLVDEVDFWIYGHHNVLSITNKIIGIPNIDRCYCVLDTLNYEFQIWHRFTEEEDYTLYMTKQIGDLYGDE